MNVSEELVTPKLAEAYLEANDGNRTLSAGRVRAYADAMTRGEWKQNGDVIRIAKTGRLLDGQHRLAAICKSGTSQRFIVVRGLPDDVFDTIDTGAARVAADILSIKGFKNSTAVAGAIRLFLTWKSTGNPVHGSPEKKPSNANILDFASSNPNVQRAGEIAVTSAFNKKLISASVIAFIYLAALDSGIGADRVEAFLSEIADPSLSGGRGATFLLRDRLMQDMGSKTRLRKYDKIALVMKAFRLWLAGIDVKNLRVRTEGETAEKDIFRIV
jgi:hypothetical protein